MVEIKKLDEYDFPDTTLSKSGYEYATEIELSKDNLKLVITKLNEIIDFINSKEN